MRNEHFSDFPKPMSARRARWEAKRAAMGYKLPRGHPYALVPRWTPYPLAKAVGRLHLAVGRPPRSTQPQSGA